MVIDNLIKVHEELQEPRCPEAVYKGDWPATCKLNTKTCIRETNPPYPCEYYNEYLEEQDADRD